MINKKSTACDKVTLVDTSGEHDLSRNTVVNIVVIESDHSHVLGLPRRRADLGGVDFVRPQEDYLDYFTDSTTVLQRLLHDLL